MQFIVEALNSINYSLTHPTAWEKASVVISAVSLILTLIVLFYNHKSISLAQKSIKQAIDLQLYEKRMDLFRQLEKQSAFKSVPPELKIVYSKEIYDLYSDIFSLCKKRIDMIAAYNTKFGLYNNIQGFYYNVCDSEMQDIKSFIIQKAKEIQESEVSDSEHRANSLIEHQKEIDLCSKEIREKYSLLEEHMKQQIKISIGL